MAYKTTKEIKSMASGGVSLGADKYCTPQAFTPTLWDSLIKEGAIVEVGNSPSVEEQAPAQPTVKTRRTRKKAVSNA
jgi:hypothetical protein